MATKVYGASDDLIEFDGDICGEVGFINDKDDRALVALSDGTLLKVGYGKEGKALWSVELVECGSLFDRIDPCADEDADPYSDVAHFRDGLKWAYCATGSWERAH